MPNRSPLSGSPLVILGMLLFIAGCAKKVPMASETQAAETMQASETTADTSWQEPTAPRGQQMQGSIEERERTVVEESMRGRAAESETLPPPAPPLSVEELVDQDVYFAYDSFTLSQETKVILERKATWLTTHPAFTVQIEGHCDERGTTAYNLALGERRAHTVKQYLVTLGVDTSRLSTISYGEEFPRDLGHNEAAWALNRRVHFTITSQ
ncbi:Peptidoglycan-associated lipoprotein [Candidatus Entotheonellaceae bacterium PAL068K]